ncbi:MAG: hypothetical protein HGA75_17495, partial [Thiobacillus sp.]|nr:hypothetical protein [Thiobacillus sp.]
QREIERCKEIAKRFLNFSRVRQSSPDWVEAAKLCEDAFAPAGLTGATLPLVLGLQELDLRPELVLRLLPAGRAVDAGAIARASRPERIPEAIRLARIAAVKTALAR